MLVWPAGMWTGLQEATKSGYPITGIMNPNSGPYSDEDSERAYQNSLTQEMKIGDGATDHSGDAKPKVNRLPRRGEGADVPWTRWQTYCYYIIVDSTYVL